MDGGNFQSPARVGVEDDVSSNKKQGKSRRRAGKEQRAARKDASSAGNDGELSQSPFLDDGHGEQPASIQDFTPLHVDGSADCNFKSDSLF